ncbi:hypothetical protein A9R97_11600 [Salmonella enterica subsp. enterica serovar Senftenberg]|nr:hypothetical protein [Salmonella enterica subsp. enterica serovar Senftenberg]
MQEIFFYNKTASLKDLLANPANNPILNYSQKIHNSNIKIDTSMCWQGKISIKKTYKIDDGTPE